MSRKISKKLSANDVGTTGAHQAGILVPKEKAILSFFPSLDPSVKNPRMTLVVRELKDGTRWEFNFIYYNNRLFGGTRNEYRLTCMTQYLPPFLVWPGVIAFPSLAKISPFRRAGALLGRLIRARCATSFRVSIS